MSLIRLIITDKTCVLTGEVHGSEADPIVASLTAEPESIEEIKLALRRFRENDSDWLESCLFRRRECAEPARFMDHIELAPYDAGIVVIDLAGRTILCDSTYSAFSIEGTIYVKDRLSEEPSPTGFPLPYRLPDDWKIINSIPEFRATAGNRRTARIASDPKDYRPVLYGEPMLRYFVKELFSKEDPASKDIIASVHADWMMTEREDLGNKSPREVLHEKRDFLDFDLHSRSLQYSFTKDCPPDLASKTHAYKFAGFGTHEIVVYYDLIRFLMDNLQKWVAEDGMSLIDKEVDRLGKLRDQWLREPDPEYSGRTPNSILESERKRRNLTMSAQESIIDEDCPICVEMSQIFDTPMFWHLDGCNMDDHFAFSFHDTIEEWEQEKAAWESHVDEERRRAILGNAKKGPIIDDPEEFIALMRGEIPW